MMSLKSRLFVLVMAAAGLAVMTVAVSGFASKDVVRFICYLTLATLSSSLNVKLPGIDGTMSVNFLFILIGIADLSFPETLALGLSATMVQCFWGHTKRIKFIQVLFNLFGMMPVAVGAAFWAYNATGHYITESMSLKLIAAGCAYFVANTVPVAVVISLAEAKPFRKIWSECYFWSFPYYLVGAGIAGFVSWANNHVGWQTSLLILPAIYWIYRSYRLYLGRLEDEKRHVEAMAALHLRTIEALALAIEAKDHTTHEHLQRVRVYAIEIAKELQVAEEEIDALRAAALLHDIGKLAVPEHIINKPGKLTPEEFEKMKIHPLVGAEILDRVSFPYPVAPIVRAHHEKWNGQGYPFGLEGEQIPIGARILAAVDCLDALASDRQYRRALPLDEAMAEVVKGSGTDFDPKVVEVLVRRYQDLEVMAQAEPMTRMAKLSTDVHVAAGQPGAGFEDQPVGDEAHFLFSIAAARQEAQELFELSHELGNSLSLDETLSVLSVRLKRLVPYDSIAIFIRRDQVLIPQYVNGDNFRLLSSLEVPFGQGLSGWVAQTERPILNGNPAVESGYNVDPSRHAMLRSAMSVPLSGVNGVVGVMTLYRTQADAFTRDHQRVLMAISSKLALSIENALRYEQAENSATTDYLTGLPNARSLFVHLDRELSRCRRTGEALTVMVCDLNGFKAINDRFGHLEGNRVLQLFASAAKTVCREYDYIARMGGDEFVIVSVGMTEAAVDHRVDVLNAAAVSAGVEVCGEQILSISVGSAFSPADGTDPEALLAEADRRMYIVKEAHHKKVAQSATLSMPLKQAAAVN